MDKLWAPWRYNYVKKPSGSKTAQGCVLCKIINSKKDRANFVIYRSEKSISVLNIFPYNNGHIMIIPKRHIKDFEKLTNTEYSDLMKHSKFIIKLLKKTFKPHGLNLGINLGRVSGAGIDKHLHLHLVPRWQGDANFMPIIANTKIISQSLADCYKLLTKNIKTIQY